ncbi:MULTISPECIES: hypothetical protein [unclassified Synechococcus]|uniref:hypothetical protein n=1 Tax=unclassified Synechococcus TaxID=2626047 RepID=UPI0039B079AA
MTQIIHTSETRITAEQMDQLLPSKAAIHQSEEIRSQPSSNSDFEPRSFDEIRKALDCIPPRVPGTGAFFQYRNALWGLQCALKEIGCDPAEAINLFRDHSPEWRDVDQVAGFDHSQMSAGSFWWFAGQHGYDLSLSDQSQPKRKRTPPIPEGKTIDELTIDEILGPKNGDTLRKPVSIDCASFSRRPTAQDSMNLPKTSK